MPQAGKSALESQQAEEDVDVDDDMLNRLAGLRAATWKMKILTSSLLLVPFLHSFYSVNKNTGEHFPTSAKKKRGNFRTFVNQIRLQSSSYTYRGVASISNDFWQIFFLKMRFSLLIGAVAFRGHLPCILFVFVYSAQSLCTYVLNHSFNIDIISQNICNIYYNI